MSENTTETTAPAAAAAAPAEKAAAKAPAKKAAAKKAAAAASKQEKVTIFLTGTSHKGKPGDRRQVDAKRAEQLVRAGLARYPASKTS